MTDNTACINLLDQRSSVDVVTPLGWFYSGPHDLLWYTFIQGAFTVLAIKEVVSIAAVCVRGRSLGLDIRRVISWDMVANWEDLRKMFQRILKPCAKDIWKRLAASCVRMAADKKRRLEDGREPLVSASGWALVMISGLISLLLFCTDLSLVVLSAPSLDEIDASQVQTMTWSNSAPIPVLTRKNVLRGSFSRTITKEALANDVEFSSQASVSLERTYFDDFGAMNAQLPPYNGTFLTCDASERWRVVCQIYTKNNLYQYKLRLDTSTFDGDNLRQYFVPVDNFSINEPSAKNSNTNSNTRTLAEYMDAMNKQLGIRAYVGSNSNSRWMINSVVQPKNETIIEGERVLMHDCLATILLSSIKICAGTKNAKMFRRPRGQRQEILEPIRGTVARSQRPRAPLLATVFAYGFLALISGVLQWKRKAGDVAKDFDIVLEVLAKRKDRTGVLNISADPLPVVFSFTDGRKSEFTDEQFLNVHEDADNPGSVILSHEGFLPARVMAPLASYMRDREGLAKEDEAEFKRKWDIL